MLHVSNSVARIMCMHNSMSETMDDSSYRLNFDLGKKNEGRILHDVDVAEYNAELHSTHAKFDVRTRPYIKLYSVPVLYLSYHLSAVQELDV